MGMRIRKMVGWGTNEFIIDDKEEFSERREALWAFSPKGWLAWLTQYENEIVEIAKQHHNPRLARPSIGINFIREWAKTPSDGLKITRPADCVAYDDEFGVDNTIMLWPFHMHHKCYRHDDLIDWFEESEHLEARFEFRERGIHPYAKGEVPESVIGACIFLDIKWIIPKLRESIYAYWA